MAENSDYVSWAQHRKSWFAHSWSTTPGAFRACD